MLVSNKQKQTSRAPSLYRGSGLSQNYRNFPDFAFWTFSAFLTFPVILITRYHVRHSWRYDNSWRDQVPIGVKVPSCLAISAMRDTFIITPLLKAYRKLHNRPDSMRWCSLERFCLKCKRIRLLHTENSFYKRQLLTVLSLWNFHISDRADSIMHVRYWL